MPIPSLLMKMSHRIEVVTVVAIGIIAGALWAFIALSDEMLEGDLHGFDEAVLLALRTPGDPSNAIGGPQIEVAMRDLTALGGVTVLTFISLSVLAYMLLLRQRSSAIFLGVAISGGLLLSNLAKYGFSRPRPDLVPHGVDAVTASFPSGHSMMAAVTYLTLAVMLARTAPQIRMRVFYIVLASIMTVLVGVSRVYLGVHWPSDVLAGWALGAAWALIVWLIARTLAQRGQIEPDCDQDI
ncbi:phosphatase PAP2 family protein [Roseovarius sp. S1116L3]|uniref:phosphatase PAP2 family protein n=1 Tax=Roseovarius roseus TaxID=3342636 RepID=UPI0037282928